MDSQYLKFGMDRILSEEISPINKKLEGKCLGDAFRANRVYSTCRSLWNSTTENTYGYPSRLQVPKLFRPHKNVPIPTKSNVDECSHSADLAEKAAKHKRSWSRAVFSNLQRKGLEKRFQMQKYITKPDRRQLAATLGLTDAQVKVWFQNRRMKWRNSKESSRQCANIDELIQNIEPNADSSPCINAESKCKRNTSLKNTKKYLRTKSDS